MPQYQDFGFQPRSRLEEVAQLRINKGPIATIRQSCSDSSVTASQWIEFSGATATFSASSRLFDLNGETKRVRKKQSSAIIAADVRRFSYLINTDEVFGTHSGRPNSDAFDVARAAAKH